MLLGDAYSPTAQRTAPPSVAPSSRPVAGDESRRAVGGPAATAAAAPRRLAAWVARSSNDRSDYDCSLVNEFFLASNCEIASERARRCGLAPLPHPVGCRWQWYISNLLFHGDSNKIIPPTWRARHHVPPAPTAMHALYVCAHGCVKHIYSGVGEYF